MIRGKGDRSLVGALDDREPVQLEQKHQKGEEYPRLRARPPRDLPASDLNDEKQDRAAHQSRKEQHSDACQDHAGQPRRGPLAFPVFRKLEGARQVDNLIARDLHRGAIVLVTHVARVTGLRLPDERIILASLALLRLGILEFKIGQLKAALSQSPFCKRARLLERK